VIQHRLKNGTLVTRYLDGAVTVSNKKEGVNINHQAGRLADECWMRFQDKLLHEAAEKLEEVQEEGEVEVSLIINGKVV
jgi:hypothetical protein